MKIHLVSDLHLEFSDYPYKAPEGTDVVIAAGDIYTKNLGPQALRNYFPDLPIIYVPGNHEYYGGSILEDGHELAKQAAEYDVHLLNPGHVILDDVIFTGGTLWTDYELWGEEWKNICKIIGRDNMNDFRKISYSKTPWVRFIPDIAEKLHKECLQEVSRGLTRAFEEGKKSVVVTHMGPHTGSVYHQYANVQNIDGKISASYCSNLEKFILEHKPNLWVHGHTHHSFDYKVGDTRVVTNPRGYAFWKNPFDQENKEFNKELIIEI